MLGFWPEGYRCAVFLSFDYDASSAEMWRTPLDLVSQSRGRFAPRVAVPRILEVLAREGLKATFFTPGWTIDNHPESVAEILSQGHELGGHGYMHERMTELSSEAEESVFERMMASMERVDVRPEGYRAPYWLVGDRTIGHLKRLGFRYSSNFMDDDMPYMLCHRGEETGLVELCPSSGCSTTGPSSRRSGGDPRRSTASGSLSSRASTSWGGTSASPVTHSALGAHPG